MSRIQWGKTGDIWVQQGLDRGVLYPPSGPAVPWNGLVSVDEDGGQETSTYYVDGRKFLSTVTPREYSATISAVTFPDEFADLCGIVEAADGLFLDSQIPDQFGLSYRTMYGDGKHYKIHLIYGVTAAMSSTTYQSLSGDSNDPTPFEFSISAIPESVAGYRPTAHVIIDTKNLDDDMVYSIENMLYGYEYDVDENGVYGPTEPHLPPIQTLFEMMNFGDVVKVIDHGDGTWTAEGSYKYVVTNDDGSFELTLAPATNLTAVDHGDGTYDLTGADA